MLEDGEVAAEGIPPLLEGETPRESEWNFELKRMDETRLFSRLEQKDGPEWFDTFDVGMTAITSAIFDLSSSISFSFLAIRAVVCIPNNGHEYSYRDPLIPWPPSPWHPVRQERRKLVNNLPKENELHDVLSWWLHEPLSLPLELRKGIECHPERTRGESAAGNESRVHYITWWTLHTLTDFQLSLRISESREEV